MSGCDLSKRAFGRSGIPFAGRVILRICEAEILSAISLASDFRIAILPRSPLRPVCASVAQLAELRFCKPGVVGSSPTASSCELWQLWCFQE